MGRTAETLLLEVKDNASSILIRIERAERGVAAGAVKADRGLRNMTRSQRALTSAGRGMGRMLMAQVTALVAMGAAFIGVRAAITQVTSAIEAFREYEFQMAAVEAVTNATASEMAAMGGVAREMGETTMFSASQAAEGMMFLGRAGFETREIMSATPAVLNLAAAAAMDLGRAADITSNIMTAFGIAGDNSAQIADAIAAAASNANTDVSMMGDAMKFVGPIARGMGVSMQDTAAAIGVLSNAGLQGSMAGTGLRRVLSSLANPTKKARAALGNLGVTMDQVNPMTNDLVDVIKVLEGAGLNAADALQIFGDRGGPAILALTSQIPQLEKLNEAVNESEGEASRMAETMRNTLKGSIVELQSVIESVRIDFAEGFAPAIRQVTEVIKSFLKDQDWDEWGRTVGGVLKFVGETLAVLYGWAEKLSKLSNPLGHLFGDPTTMSEGLQQMADAGNAMIELERLQGIVNEQLREAKVARGELVEVTERYDEAQKSVNMRTELGRAITKHYLSVVDQMKTAEESLETRLDTTTQAIKDRKEALVELRAEYRETIKVIRDELRTAEEAAEQAEAVLSKLDDRESKDLIDTSSLDASLTAALEGSVSDWANAITVATATKSRELEDSLVSAFKNGTDSWVDGLSMAIDKIGGRLDSTFGGKGSFTALLSGGGQLFNSVRDLNAAQENLVEVQASVTSGALKGAEAADALAAAQEGVASASAGAIHGLIAIADAALSILKVSGLLGTARGKDEFGADTAGNFQVEGEQVGGAAGAIAGGVIGFAIGGAMGAALGSALGESIGALLGAVVGSFINSGADQIFAQVQQQADGHIRTAMVVSEGKMTEVGQNLGDSIIGAVTGVVDALGGQIAHFAGIDIGIRAGEFVKVALPGIERQFEATREGIQQALEFAVVESLRRSNITGLSPTVKAALESFKGDTVEALEKAIAFAITIDNLGLTQFEQDLAAKTTELGKLLDIAINDFGAGARNVLMGPGGLVSAFQDAYDQTFGIQKDQGEVTAQRIAGLQAQIAIAKAQLIVMREELLMRKVEVESRAAALGAHVDIVSATNQVAEAEIRGKIAVAEATGASAMVHASSAEQIIEALSAIDAALGALEAFDFSPAAIQAAISRARNAARNVPSVGGIGGGGTGGPEFDLESFMNPIREVIAQAQESDFITRMRHITERYGEAQRALEDALAAGDITAQEFTSALSELTEAMGIEEAIIAEERLTAERDAAAAATLALERQFDSLVSTFAGLGSQTAQNYLEAQKYIAALAALNQAVADGQVTAGMAAQAFQEIATQAFFNAADAIISFAQRWGHELGVSQETWQAFNDLRWEIELAQLRHQITLLHELEFISTETFEGMLALINEMHDVGPPAAGAPPGFNPPPAPPPPQQQTEQLSDVLEDMEAWITGLQRDAMHPLERQLKELNEEYLELQRRLAAHGGTVAHMTELEQALADAREDIMEQSLANIQDFYDSLTTGPQSIAPLQDQLLTAQAEFERLAALAAAGDFNARDQLSGAGQHLLDLAEQMFGGTAGFFDLRNLVLGQVGGILGENPFSGGTSKDDAVVNALVGSSRKTLIEAMEEVRDEIAFANGHNIRKQDAIRDELVAIRTAEADKNFEQVA